MSMMKKELPLMFQAKIRKICMIVFVLAELVILVAMPLSILHNSSAPVAKLMSITVVGVICFTGIAGCISLLTYESVANRIFKKKEQITLDKMENKMYTS
jgi:hypothetical protein